MPEVVLCPPWIATLICLYAHIHVDTHDVHRHKHQNKKRTGHHCLVSESYWRVLLALPCWVCSFQLVYKQSRRMVTSWSLYCFWWSLLLDGLCVLSDLSTWLSFQVPAADTSLHPFGALNLRRPYKPICPSMPLFSEMAGWGPHRGESPMTCMEQEMQNCH